MRVNLRLLAIALLMTCLALDQQPIETPRVPLVSLSGRDSRIEQPLMLRITAQEQWTALWARHVGSSVEAVPNYHNPTACPAIDFDRCMVVAVFRGSTINNSGVKAVNVEEDEQQLRLHLEDQWFQTSAHFHEGPGLLTGVPAGGAHKGTATSPYGIFILPKSSKRIAFLINEEQRRDKPARWVEQAALPAASPEPKQGQQDTAIPLIDLSAETYRQVIVDREAGQYLGHPTTVLLEDGKTILCVYPKGHGRGPIVYKRSEDGGLTWSDRLPTPASWETSKETPTIHRVVDAGGTRRLILWSGLHPARLSVSEDDGRTWSELEPAGDWGGIVVMSSIVKLKEPGHYLALFHDDGRFFRPKPDVQDPPVMTLYQTLSTDGGLTWGEPEALYASSDVHLCEPGAIRSPDGKRLAMLLRENARRKNSHVMFSDDEGKTWSQPRELPSTLTGDRHTAVYAPDGRLFISFRDMADGFPTRGDWVAWVGGWEDLESGGQGQYRVRLMDNRKGTDCAYSGVEVLPDGTIVTTTYGHWTEGEEPYIVSVRLKLEELEAIRPGSE